MAKFHTEYSFIETDLDQLNTFIIYQIYALFIF